MHHEFRQPISSSLAFIEILISMAVNQHIMALLKLIQSSLSMLLSYVDDLVDLERIKSDMWLEKSSNFSPASAIEYVC